MNSFKVFLKNICGQIQIAFPVGKTPQEASFKCNLILEQKNQFLNNDNNS